ncbi:hypothetical protein LTT02_01160 [Mycolicibacterium smegmatis]|uniref:hypothetical protein n=1 Tax=Mycolicibacterium smegmatis TaxID=1772 RepID=UPI0005DA1D03|nr:hypothetical protein [Mycolicibacterium smegmatis]MCP2625252.1 hypothetical protein [Mycolicibacterium smegmatis]MDF1899224.1 hypothetical protein [Mycolicibacterium smegmatis]MDF1904636.1 hypothetical protein [Mycolicibacterium smegmatis]MDF1918505.1 hypothetical protein [Mycolicibacterium smegmatis]MDF1923800.1 hypothetical protein [Mycolicibacterium smegmatis]
MSTPTKTNKRSSLTKYEAIGSTGDPTTAESLIVATEYESLIVATEYESPNGLDLNNTDPDQRRGRRAWVGRTCRARIDRF